MEEDFSIQLERVERLSLPFKGLFAVCDIYSDIIGAVLLDDENVCTTFTTNGCTVTSCGPFIKRWAKRGQMILGQDKRENRVELLVLDINYEPLDFYLTPLLRREDQNTIILSQYEKYRDHVKDIIPEMWKNENHLSAVKPQRGTKEPRL